MRIVNIIGSLGMGGAEKVVSVTSREFARGSHGIVVIALSSGPLLQELRQSGVEVVIVPFSWSLFPVCLFRIVRELRTRKIDVLHTHLFTTDVLGRIAGWIARTPVIVSTLHAPSSWKASKTLKNRLKRWADRITANRFNDGLIAISEEVKRYQVKVGGLDARRMQVISNPVSIGDFTVEPAEREKLRSGFGFRPEDFIITNVGSLKPIKGQDTLMKAVSRLRDAYDCLRLVFVGDGPSRTLLESLAEELGVRDIVRFMGVRNDVPRILACSDLFVMPSLSEGISMAMLEAMASKLPVVATAVGGNVDLIEHSVTGVLVASQDEKGLAEAIADLVKQPEKRQVIGRNAFEYVKGHNGAKAVADRLLQYYSSLMASQNESGCLPGAAGRGRE